MTYELTPSDCIVITPEHIRMMQLAMRHGADEYDFSDLYDDED